MTLSELITTLRAITGFADKVVFNGEPTDEGIHLPYINVQTPTTMTFAADNVTYYASPNADIEFYSRFKDPTNEALIEECLTENGLYFSKYEGRIDSQSCYQVVYSIGV